MAFLHISIPGDKANAEYHAIESEAGKALFTWMDIEVQAQQSFGIAIDARNDKAGKAVFRAAINTNARLAMANEAVLHALAAPGGEELSERWKKLYDKAKKLAKRRNAIAHGRVVIVMGKPDKNGVSIGMGARIIDPLIPPEIPPNPTRQLVEGISVEQLIDLRERFHNLAHSIYVHGQEMQQFLAPPEESQKR